MAHAATLNGLTESLITSISGLAPHDPAFAKVKEKTFRSLKAQTSARINQFAINDSLHGLVEKFAVRNREDLGDALEQRLEELPTNSRWTPEILSLLLLLQDRPVEKTRVSDVERANQTEQTRTADLTWDDIIAADPFDEPHIWDNIEPGYHSSEDDDFEDVLESEPTTSTKATSVVDDDPADIPRQHLLAPGEDALFRVKASRETWRQGTKHSPALELAELAVVRETLLMLSGVSTDLFDKDHATGRVTLTRNARLSTASKSTLNSILESATSTGRALNHLRQWLLSPQKQVYVRSIQAAVQAQVSAFNAQLGKIAQRYVAPNSDTAVSTINVLTEAQSACTSLARISLLAQLSSLATGPGSHFTVLNYLYDEAGIAQMAGDVPLFASLNAAFSAGLKTYLRSVHAWIRTGTVDPTNIEYFFVADANPACPPGEMWHSRYKMRLQADGVPLAPKCMQTHASVAFALGKSKSFLDRLDPANSSSPENQDLFPNLDDMESQIQRNSLMSFSQLLDDMLERWISGINADCTPLLRSKLLEEYGLLRELTALSFVFFGKDGSTFQTLAEPLLRRVSEHQGTYQGDTFLLAELGRSTYSSLSGVQAESVHISIAAATNPVATSCIRRLGSVQLHYLLPWPIQNITHCRSPESHAKVFAFLLQLQYILNLLDVRIFDLRGNQPIAGVSLRLRQRLLCVVRLFQEHASSTANFLNAEMCASMGRAEDIDTMSHIWSEYEKRLQTSLLLAPSYAPVRNAMMSILEVAEVFSKTARPSGVAPLAEQHERSMSFLIPAIRAVSRASGDHALEALADKLEWTVK